MPDGGPLSSPRVVSLTDVFPLFGLVRPGRSVLRSAVQNATALLHGRVDPALAAMDQAIPTWVIERAQGLAFMWVCKVGFVATVSVGSGIVISRCTLPDGSRGWSAPSAFTISGGGGGLEFGGAMQHVIMVLNTEEAVNHFAGRGLNMSFTLQAAIGPHQVGRCVEGGVRLSLDTSKGPNGRTSTALIPHGQPNAPPPPRPHIAPSYIYGEAGGFFLGAGIQAGLIIPRDWENAAYYGVHSAPASLILSGGLGLTDPWPEVVQLHRTLAMAQDSHADWAELGAAGGSGGGTPRLGTDAESGEFELFVPGGLCVFGEHSDWAGAYRSPHSQQSAADAAAAAAASTAAFLEAADQGACDTPPSRIAAGATLVVGFSNEGIYARARRRKGVLVLRSVLDRGEVVGPIEFKFEESVLAEVAAEGGFWSYAAGVALRVMQLGFLGPEGGLEIDNYRTTLPVRKGLSSSAAMCVLVARAFSRAYGMGLSIRGEMELAYQGERSTPSLCGRMDQACAYGPRPVLLRHDGDQLDVEELVIGTTFHWVVADLSSSKSTTAILRALQAAFPVPTTPDHAAVHQLLGEGNLEVVRRAVALLAAGDAPGLGQLMLEAQTEFDRVGGAVCPEELTAPVLHTVLAHAGLREVTWGGKGVGSQGDGSVQFLCKGEAGQAAAASILEKELGLFTIKLSFGPSGGIAGVGAAGGSPAGVAATDSLIIAAGMPRQLSSSSDTAAWLKRTKSQLELARRKASEKLKL